MRILGIKWTNSFAKSVSIDDSEVDALYIYLTFSFDLIYYNLNLQSTLSRVHVGPQHTVIVGAADLYLPLALNLYENGKLTLPSTTKTYGTQNYLAGELGNLL